MTTYPSRPTSDREWSERKYEVRGPCSELLKGCHYEVNGEMVLRSFAVLIDHVVYFSGLQYEAGYEAGKLAAEKRAVEAARKRALGT